MSLPNLPGRHNITAAEIVAAAVSALIFSVLFFQAAIFHDFAPLDKRIAEGVDSHRLSWLTPIAWAITTLGGSVVLGLLILAGLIWGIRKRTLWPIAFLSASLVLSNVLTRFGKQLADRPRPPRDWAVADFHGLGFPSGHASQATAVCLALAVLALRSDLIHRAALAWGCAIMAFLIGISRIYLGAHWTSDVIGGFALGTVCTAILLAIVPVPPRKDSKQRSISTHSVDTAKRQ